jgi:hypothetical protein
MIAETASPGQSATAAQALVAMAERMDPVPSIRFLQDWQTALRKITGSRPAEQARPMHPDMFLIVLTLAETSKEPGLRLLVWVAWKTSSRVDEVANLNCNSFHILSPMEILVDFCITKTNQAGQWRLDHLVIIQQTRGIPQWVFQAIANLSCTAPLYPHTTSHLDKWLAKIPVTDFPPLAPFMEPEHGFTRQKRHLTAHSFKRGAQAVLWVAASKNLIPVELVQRMAKHRNGPDLIPGTTIGYAPSKILVAQAGGSQMATRLL